jgi:hypothetical protein
MSASVDNRTKTEISLNFLRLDEEKVFEVMDKNDGLITIGWIHVSIHLVVFVTRTID